MTAVWLVSLPAFAEPPVDEYLELAQRQKVVVDHQRFVGNIRAQAQRDGIVVHVPQLYVYLSDFAPVWHLAGFNDGFERELGITVNHQRAERSMVRLDRMLERMTTLDGQDITLEDLPATDIYLLLYRRANCPDCERVEETLIEWVEGTPDQSVMWIDVWLGPRVTE